MDLLVETSVSLSSFVHSTKIKLGSKYAMSKSELI